MYAVTQDILLTALKPIHVQEKDGLMHLSEVRELSACNLKDKHPGTDNVVHVNADQPGQGEHRVPRTGS
eukprot:8768889-Prorocentrum_lima.AAC.1